MRIDADQIRQLNFVPVDKFDEDFVKRCIFAYPDKSRLAIDLGAEHGRHTEHMFDAGFKHIQSYEPAPYNMKILHETRDQRHWNNVDLFECAVGVDGFARLWMSPWTVGHTTNTEIAKGYWPGNPGWKFGGQFMDVRSVSLDQIWVDVSGWQTVGLIKCDIEGGELVAFQNAAKLLQDNRNWLWIIMEVHRGIDLEALYLCLNQAGYYWHDNQGHLVDKLTAGRHYLVRALS